MILEEDGIKCFDLDALHSDAQDDLRMSIGAQTKQMPPPNVRRGRSATADQHMLGSGESPEAELIS